MKQTDINLSADPLGYHLKDPQLLDNVMTHGSTATWRMLQQNSRSKTEQMHEKLASIC